MSLRKKKLKFNSEKNKQKIQELTTKLSDTKSILKKLSFWLHKLEYQITKNHPENLKVFDSKIDYKL